MALTVKQRRALRRAPKRARGRMANTFARQDAMRTVGRRRRNGGTPAFRGIVQGVGRSVTNAFGANTMTRYNPCLLDAFHLSHLPLPRAVGPYTVCRVTEAISTDDALVILGPQFNRAESRWTTGCAMSWQEVNTALNASSGFTLHKFDAIAANDSWTGAQITPAAYSVQIMNPNALQTTNGIAYLGRVRTSWKPNASGAKTAASAAVELVSYNNPRLCSAAKLAFRGVQVDLVPFNMSQLADFTSFSDDTFSSIGDASPMPYGFAPMFIWNPQKINLQFLVAAEFRVRFDPSNPAQATHVHHPPASESLWSQVQRAAEAAGHGVRDIADGVAATGNAVGRAMGTAYALRRGAGALALMG